MFRSVHVFRVKRDIPVFLYTNSSVHSVNRSPVSISDALQTARLGDEDSNARVSLQSALLIDKTARTE
jgi:Mrp family chromosome partitioning ATPase